MEEEKANFLFESGAIFILLDVPENTEFGIDYQCWRTGPNFRGVKMIPPGFHFIYYSAADKKHGQVCGARNGFFHNFQKREILAKKWNSTNESIDEYLFSDEEMQRFDSNRKEMDRFLGAYPYDEYKRWLSLTNHFNEKLVNKLEPESKIITSESSLIGRKFVSKGDRKASETLFTVPKSLEEAEKQLPEMDVIKTALIQFTKIPTELYPKGSTSLEITRHSIDTTYRLEQFIQRQNERLDLTEFNYGNVLCEFQFAFVCFLVGQAHAAFDQWKQLFFVLSNAEAAVEKFTNLYLHFVQVVYFQMKEMPQDLCSDEMLINGKDNLITVNLHNFFNNVESCVLRKKETSGESSILLNRLNEKCKDFKNYLQEKFQFDFEQEPDEYAPVVCEIDEEKN